MNLYMLDRDTYQRQMKISQKVVLILFLFVSRFSQSGSFSAAKQRKIGAIFGMLHITFGLSFGIGYIRCFNKMAIILKCIRIPPSVFDVSIFEYCDQYFYHWRILIATPGKLREDRMAKAQKTTNTKPCISLIYLFHIYCTFIQGHRHVRCFNQMVNIFIIFIGSPLQSSKVQNI